MKKIPCLFERDFTDKKNIKLLDKVTPGCEWVAAGEGIATRKWDGTAVLIKVEMNEIKSRVEKILFFKRYDSKHGKTPPEGFLPCQDSDPVTGHWPGWIPVDVYMTVGSDNKRVYRDGRPENKWILDAYWNYVTRENSALVVPEDVLIVPEEGTYEAIGEKIGSNHEMIKGHTLKRHGDTIYDGQELTDRSFEGIKKFLTQHRIEGIVFHHPDGRMCKIRRDNFELTWP